MKTALVTPFLHHLPLHPGAYLGYGAAVLRKRYENDIIDINSEAYFCHKTELKKILADFAAKRIVVDANDLQPLYHRWRNDAAKKMAKVSWRNYRKVFITTPSWFVTVPTEAILHLCQTIRNETTDIEILFFGNSLESWTNAKKLAQHDIQIRHLNDLFKKNPANSPVDFDALPLPVYEKRNQYIFDILPFRLKHGCVWGKCRFCSLARGWNAGYVERSVQKAITEVEKLIDNYSPKILVCRDNSINGKNLLKFCRAFANLRKPWLAMARADLSKIEIGALGKAGCRLIYFGLESGSNRVLREINKGIDTGRMSRFIKALHDNGIIPAPSVFVGAPGETDDDFKKTVRFILDHRRFFDTINLYPFRKTPASEFWLSKKESHKKVQNRLKKLTWICLDMGLKVCIGEQSAEYVLFNRVYPGDPGG